MPEINVDFFLRTENKFKEEEKNRFKQAIATQMRLLGARSEILMRRSSRPTDDKCQQPKQRRGRQVAFFDWTTRIEWIKLEKMRSLRPS